MTALDRDALLRRMDLNMWEMFRDITRASRSGEVHDLPGLTLHAHPHGSPFNNMVMVRDAAMDADTLLAAVRGLHGHRGLPFSIGYRAHADTALEADLFARGFTPFVTLPAMALLEDPGTVCEPEGLDVRPATTDAGRRDYLEVTAAAYAEYQQTRELTEDLFASLESVCAPHVQGFVGYAGGAPVAAAAVYVTHGVAGIGWVGTTGAARGRRYAEAVTWAAVREGLRRGAGFANLQASPMGRPVYERMGFATPSEYRTVVGSL